MQISAISLRTYLTALLFLITASFSTYSFAITTKTLARNSWAIISIPADPGGEGTVQALLGDDLPTDRYGASADWVVYEYVIEQNSFRALELSDSFVANVSYWIIQNVEDSVELDLPDSLDEVAGSVIPGCPAELTCAAHRLEGDAAEHRWNLVGTSLDSEISFGDTRFQASNSACADGCTPDEAKAEGLIGPAYRFNGTSYEVVAASTVLQPWDGIWIAVLAGNPAFDWILPVGEDTPPPPEPDPDPVDAELDMARLLMQGSFGATVEDMAAGLELGGPVEWIDAQMSLPAETHTGLVRQLITERFTGDNGPDRQRARYIAYWRKALRADDQLRQRVAFALSQIFVISDKSGKLTKNGNHLSKYYDILINNAFGNFRQLLEEVTLNPAMGRYLSMLGNDKPNNATGKRADENYAREVMQLFTIGLVPLNLDGSERAGDPTYTQDDVENLARVFTGWYWDEDEPRWRANANYRPNDLDALEAQMVAFPDHHDTDQKVFMGTTIAAGQTAEQELKIVLDILFNHPNAGPFIGEQLIKRLVTSNPSPGYVRRVASAFNDNGAGVRGDMAAVVKAILLDDEARNQTTRNRTDYGKLREPLLRYAAMWRAFNANGDVAINIYHTTQALRQAAPLTAPSVFNFYSPSFAPQGAITDAGLVAPEFQINSEAASNTINSSLMKAVIDNDMLRTGENNRLTKLELDVSEETDMLERSAAELIDHLDMLLTANTLTDDSKAILTKYIDENRGSIPADRLVRDVIGLVVTSTEYAIQR